MNGDRIAMSQPERDRSKVMSVMLEGRRTRWRLGGCWAYAFVKFFVFNVGSSWKVILAWSIGNAGTHFTEPRMPRCEERCWRHCVVICISKGECRTHPQYHRKRAL